MDKVDSDLVNLLKTQVGDSEVTRRPFGQAPKSGDLRGLVHPLGLAR